MSQFAPKRAKLDDDKLRTNSSDARRLIIILEGASLEIAKIGPKYELLTSEKHGNLIRKMNKDLADYRPDITHQCLLMLFDSPLNRANMLRVFVHTQRNALIEISAQTRIPRTFDRFAGLMVQLLHKLTINAADSHTTLMKIIKNPVTDHLPAGALKYALSFDAKQLTNLHDIVPKLSEKPKPVVFVIGAIAKGDIDNAVDYVDERIKISNYPLSAALTCAKLTHIFEEEWQILC